MKKALSKTILVLLFSLTLFNTSKAQFNGNFIPANWSLSQVNSNGSLDTVPAPAFIVLASGNNGSALPGVNDFSIVMPQSGFINFLWAYNSTDTAASDYPQYLLNGVATTVQNYNMGGLNMQTGAQNCIAVEAGDVFGLRMYTADNLSGDALTIFSSFSFSPVTISPANATVCFGDSLALIASGAVNYLWSGGITNGVFFTPAVSAEYTVTAAIPGCTTTATRYVTVNTLPNITISGGALPLCTGSTGTLTASGAVNYTWSTGSLNDSTVVSPIITTTYSVIATDAYNCSNSAALVLTVNPLPVLIISAATNTILCAGQTTTLLAAGANSYSWSTGSLTYSTNVSPVITTTYSLSATDANNCFNSTVQTIIVNPLPTLTISVATNTVLCSGSTTTLMVSGAATYSWSTGSLINSTAATPFTNTTYTIFATDANNCSNSAMQTIAVNPLPIITVNAAANPICEGSMSVLNVNGANTYIWNTGAITNSIIITPTITTTYSVNGTDVNGCINTGTCNVSVNPLPVISATSSSSVICIGQSATVSANGATTYAWNTPNGIGSTVVVSPNVNTAYTVYGIDANGCMNSAVITQSVNICAGLQIFNAELHDIKVFPNPGNGEFSVNLGSFMENTSIEIINVLGQLIQRETANSANTIINITQMSSGIYYVKITQGNQVIGQVKVFKQ